MLLYINTWTEFNELARGHLRINYFVTETIVPVEPSRSIPIQSIARHFRDTLDKNVVGFLLSHSQPYEK